MFNERVKRHCSAVLAHGNDVIPIRGARKGADAIDDILRVAKADDGYDNKIAVRGCRSFSPDRRLLSESQFWNPIFIL